MVTSGQQDKCKYSLWTRRGSIIKIQHKQSMMYARSVVPPGTSQLLEIQPKVLSRCQMRERGLFLRSSLRIVHDVSSRSLVLGLKKKFL